MTYQMNDMLVKMYRIHAQYYQKWAYAWMTLSILQGGVIFLLTDYLINATP